MKLVTGLTGSSEPGEREESGGIHYELRRQLWVFPGTLKRGI
jgi:hypothetical protein